MPVKVERRLRARGRRKHLKGKRLKRYIYGTMNKLGMLRRGKKRHTGRKRR